jgi:Secretion system C-terminal sorting domain
MKRLVLIYCLFFAQILRGVSQNVTINLSPQIVNATISPDTFEVRGKAMFKNTSNSTKKFAWKRTIVAMTSGWQALVCDAKGCWNAQSSESSEHIDIAPNSTSVLDVNIRPNRTAGSATIEVKIYEIGNEANAVTGRYLFTTTTTTASKESGKNNTGVRVFPNPTTDFFSIQDDYDVVERVVVYNMIGRVMKNYATNANNNNRYTITDLPEGLYVIRLLNARGGTVKTIRLNKSKAKA